jgi:hypothetical protein
MNANEMKRAEYVTQLLVAQRQIIELQEENASLRNYLLSLARSCQECDGTGTATLADDRIGPCPDCAGIRRVLA